MIRKSSSLGTRVALCLAACIALVAAAPGAVLADHDHRDDRVRRVPWPHVPVYRHGESCDRSVRTYANPRSHQHATYTCRPCAHRFASQAAFQRHLRHHHHVATWAFPFVIVRHALGWVFYG